MIMDPVYGYEAVNVEAQSRSLASLLSWTKRLISVRKSSKVFGRGSLAFIRPANRSVLVYVRQYQNEVLLCVANMSRSAQAAEIDLSPWRGRVPLELLGPNELPADRRESLPRSRSRPTGSSGSSSATAGRLAIEAPIDRPEFETLVVTAGWTSLLQGRARPVLERDVLPAFLAGRRWFAERGDTPIATQIAGDPARAAGARLRAGGDRGAGQAAKPRVICCRSTSNGTRFDPLRKRPECARCGAARPAGRNADRRDRGRDFISFLLENLRRSQTIEADRAPDRLSPDATICRRSTQARIEMYAPWTPSSRIPRRSSATHFVVKLFRRLEPGINPEIEVGRFLTETVPFANTPPLLGTVELEEDGTCSAIAVVHGFVENQGDAWTVTSAYLDRFVEEQHLLTAEAADRSDERARLCTADEAGRTSVLPSCSSRWPAATTFPISLPSHRGRRRSSDGPTASCGGPKRSFEELARRRADLTERDRALVEALAACRKRLPERLQRVAARKHRAR